MNAMRSKPRLSAFTVHNNERTSEPTSHLAIRLQSIEFSYSRRGRRTESALISGISFDFFYGELVGLFGRSGCGKSTLLRIMAGLLPPLSGRVEFGSRRRVAYVPQDDLLAGHLTVAETLRYHARIRSLERTTSAIQRLLERFGLSNQADRRVNRLSGGERRRANILVDLLVEPDILLLDEPTAGLDSDTSATILGLLGELTAQAVCVVMISHRREDLERCSRSIDLERAIIAGRQQAGL